MHRKQDHRSAEMEYSGARLAVNVAFIALVAAAAAFAATGLIGPALAAFVAFVAEWRKRERRKSK